MKKHASSSRSVVIVQRVLPHYRVAFFDRLHERLRERAIHLHLVYGQEWPGTVPVTVDFPRDWATRINNRYIRFAGLNLVWQPCLSIVAASDLVIVEQANSLLLNYGLLAARQCGLQRVAYWGHGQNFQAGGKNGFRETLKAALLTPVDWWFAYTELSAAIVKSKEFPVERISVVNNAIDTDDFHSALASISSEAVAQLRESLGLSGEPVAIYCGGLYADKKLDFLLVSSLKIRDRIKDFHLIILGSGPEQAKISQAASEYPWIHYVGAQFGPDRAVYFKAAEIFLMPGLVGLAILDAFTAEIPLFTTDVPIHSPEIAYLSHGDNGVMTAHDTEAYADAVAGYFADSTQRERLRRGCRESAEKYRLDNFVDSLADGIEQCLKTPSD